MGPASSRPELTRARNANSSGAIVAIATAMAAGESQVAVLRLSGPGAFAIAARAGLPVPDAWRHVQAEWHIAGGCCPCRVFAARAPRSATGEDTVEISVPGAPDLAELARSALVEAGAEAAAPGAFTRRALANGKLSLTQAEALLALTHAHDATAASAALARLRGALADDLAAVRTRLIELRAMVEAGLDFGDESDVRSFDAAALMRDCAGLVARLERWRVTAGSLETRVTVCLVGAPNAGKSALFRALTGHPALVSPIAGTTRDQVEADWRLSSGPTTLIDTAGWMAPANHLDAEAIAMGQRAVDGAAVVLACTAPDAPLPAHQLPTERTLRIATKADLGGIDERADLAVSAITGAGLSELAALVAARLAQHTSAEPRQQRLLSAALAVLTPVVTSLPDDELLADDLRRAADALGELIGATTTDDVLGAIFSRFCIGK